MPKNAFKILVVVAGYKCDGCGRVIRINQFGSKVLKAPINCPKCGGKKFTFNPIQSDWVDAKTEEAWTVR